jgi:hypothetical protein
MWGARDPKPVLQQVSSTVAAALNDASDNQSTDLPNPGYPFDTYNRPLTPIVKWRSTTTVKLARNVPRELLDETAALPASRVNSPGTPSIRPRYGAAQLTVVGDTQPNTRTYIQTSNGTLVPRLALNTLPPSPGASLATTTRASTAPRAAGGRADWNKTARTQQRVKYGSWFVPPEDWREVYGANHQEGDSPPGQKLTSRLRSSKEQATLRLHVSEAGSRQATLRQELAGCYALTVYKK